jgi:hypothetical protein
VAREMYPRFIADWWLGIFSSRAYHNRNTARLPGSTLTTTNVTILPRASSINMNS